MTALRRICPCLLLLWTAGLGFAQEKDFSGKEVIRQNFEGKDLADANFEDAVIKETKFTSAILRKANFRSAFMSYGTFRNADLQGADFRDAKLENVLITGADFSGANLEGASLASVPMYSTKFRNANLRNLKRTSSFENCDLFGADLRGANLREMTVYRGSVFRKAKYDSKTTWPVGFDPKEQGAVFVETADEPSPKKGAAPNRTETSDAPKKPKPTLGGGDRAEDQEPNPTNQNLTVLEGRENLQGFGALKFVIIGYGKVDMIDASKKVIRGSFAFKGDRVTFTFPDCVYEGRENGDVLEGQARFTKGEASGTTWTFRVVRVSPNAPANPPVAPKVGRIILRGEEDLPGFGPLAFDLDGKGQVVMHDASKQAARGEYRIAGNRYTMTFNGCVYDGTANGNTIVGKARNDKGDAWNFKVAIEGGDQPVVDPAPPAPPAPLINPGPQGTLPLNGLYMKVYQANGSAIIELFYFTPDGKVSTRPFGGINPFDWTSAAKNYPGYTGTYTIQGGNILMRMGDGKTRKETYGVNNEGVQLDGYLAQRVDAFPQGAKLTGRWGGSSSSAFGVDRATAAWTFTFKNDGAYGLERGSTVLARGPDVTGSGGADSKESGTFSLAGNTLRLNPSQGQPRNLTIFPYEGFRNEQQFNIEGMLFRHSK